LHGAKLSLQFVETLLQPRNSARAPVNTRRAREMLNARGEILFHKFLSPARDYYLASVVRILAATTLRLIPQSAHPQSFRSRL
jgi:hypothetical protein